MRTLLTKEIKRVSGGKTDWDAYNKKHGYGQMPNPPTMDGFSSAVTEGAIVGAYFGGPIGAIEGAGVGGSVYIIHNGYTNIKNYYF